MDKKQYLKKSLYIFKGTINREFYSVQYSYFIFYILSAIKIL